MARSEASRSQQASGAGAVMPSPVATMSPFHEGSSTATLVLEVVKRSVPLGLAAAAQMSISVVLVAMTGSIIGEAALGATTLACGLLNATAFSFAAGFCGALETVLSHSYGRDPHSKLFGVYAQRMSMMLLIIAACVGPLLAFSDSLLIAIGQNRQVAYHTGQFCRVALFGVYSVMLLEMMRRYFACQHLNRQLSINLVTGAVSFPFVLWVCLKVFGFNGAAIAWVTLMTCMTASLFMYLYWTGKYKKTWGGWDPTALMNWRPLLRLAFPSMAMMMSEWMSLEINLIIAGYATTNDLAAFSVIYQCSGIMWSIASGVFIEAAVLVGNAIGQGKPQFAKRCAVICLGCAMGFAVFNLAVLLCFRNQIPRLFSKSAEVHATCIRLLPFFVIYHFFDCVQSCMMGVLRGCGLQSLGALAIALVYSVVGVPVGALLFFLTSFGIRSLWLGPALGVSVVGFPLYCFLFKFYIPWDKLEDRERELPSLNTSMDERSMRAYTTTPPPSASSSDNEEPLTGCDGDDDGENNTGAGGGRTRGRHTPTTHPAGAGAPVENGSFTSLNNFYLPQRSILSVPPFFAGSPNPSEPHPSPVLAEDDETVAVNKSTSAPFLLPPLNTGRLSMSSPNPKRRHGLGSSGHSSRRSPSAPPSSASSASTPRVGIRGDLPAAGAGAVAAASVPRGRSRSRSSSLSASMGPGRGGGQGTNLPSSASSESCGALST